MFKFNIEERVLIDQKLAKEFGLHFPDSVYRITQRITLDNINYYVLDKCGDIHFPEMMLKKVLA